MSNRKASSGAPSLSPHTKTEPIADAIDGKLYCSDCLKNAVRIDEDGSEYPNKKAYEESYAKYHPKKPSPSLSAKELSAKLKAGTPGWGLNNRKYYDGKNDYYGVRCAVLEEVIASLEAEESAPAPTNQQQILERLRKEVKILQAWGKGPKGIWDLGQNNASSLQLSTIELRYMAGRIESIVQALEGSAPGPQSQILESVRKEIAAIESTKQAYHCLDCGQLVSLDGYAYHNSDHTLKVIYVLQERDLKALEKHAKEDML